jgi:hypothetical protein
MKRNHHSETQSENLVGSPSKLVKSMRVINLMENNNGKQINQRSRYILGVGIVN